MLTKQQFAFAAFPECTLISRAHQGATQFSGHTPNANDAYDPSCSIMHLVLPPSADLYAQVNICLQAWFNICFDSIAIYMLYMLARLFTPFDAHVYSIEGGHQYIKFRLSTYAYTHSC